MDRETLTKGFNLIREAAKAGKLHVGPKATALIDSLDRVRFADDGLIDEATADSTVRVTALAFLGMEQERELVSVPLITVQEQYYSILTDSVGWLFDEMQKRGADPSDAARIIASDPDEVKGLSARHDEFFAQMREFWEAYGPVMEAHSRASRNLRGVFGGDIFPSEQSDLAAGLGLYLDTLVLPDPILKIENNRIFSSESQTVFYLVKHMLNALRYRDLALADVPVPIVVIAPPTILSDKESMDRLTAMSQNEALRHLNLVFGARYASVEEAREELSKCKSIEDVAGRVQRPDRFLMNASVERDPTTQLESQMKFAQRTAPGLAEFTPGAMAFLGLTGRFGQAADVIWQSMLHAGTPLVDAPTSWEYLLWTYEYGGGTQAGDPTSLVISKALQAEGNDRLQLLTSVPHSALIELRKKNVMEELRAILRDGMGDLADAKDPQIANVGERVAKNLSGAFEKHNRELQKHLKAHIKFYGFDVGKWIATTAISIAAAVVPELKALAVGTALLSAFGGKTPKQLRDSAVELNREKARLANSATGILFRALEEPAVRSRE